MKKNIFKYLLVAGIASVAIFSGCRKETAADKVTGQAANNGKTLIGFPGGMVNSTFFEPFTNIKTVDVFTLKKDAKDQAESNKAQTFVLTSLPDALTKYNEKNGSSYELLPKSYYTLGNANTTQATNGDLTFKFAAGAFAEDFIIKLDGSKLDLSKTYGLAYKLTGTDGLGVHAASKDTLYAFFSVKNKWDGVYEITGTMVDKTNSTLGHINEFLSSSTNTTGVAAPMQFELRTISATKCEVYDNYFFGGNYMPIRSGTSYSQYGSFALIIEFDPATNKVAAVTNYYGQPASNTRSAALDPSGVNAYDPGTKTIDIIYNMLQPSVVTAAPYIRTTWTETWKYIGSR
ncbi:DUF1735 domain-containing protein [Mucilaginibacter sp. SJ]|uniref:DUF1735 domain-containing protein n=1 Tax=Mucilaginibacter sp. SJ TaxID=3029053 RepID=UPI0023AA097C|nr:DUF1735 domain-containing protein [Mucilaginibacter sp. SJ]WEA01158.1 DUF1735 domain-containing protein [Mucilaginibacter sp. SJ]